MKSNEYIILVDKDDNVIGKAEKIMAHQLNLLHRAFSIFIFRLKKENITWEKNFLPHFVKNTIADAKKNKQEIREIQQIDYSNTNFYNIDFSNIEFLIQQRASIKYHSALLWTNTCCSHPQPNETILQAANRRLHEEFGIQTNLKSVGTFHYNSFYDNKLSENEIDHVLVGYIPHHTTLLPDHNEIEKYRWLGLQELEYELAKNPQNFTSWFQSALNLVKENHKKLF